jgi:hypothetical protein
MLDRLFCQKTKKVFWVVLDVWHADRTSNVVPVAAWRNRADVIHGLWILQR